MRKSSPFPLCLCPSGRWGMCQSLIIKPITRKQNAWIQWCCFIVGFNPCFPHAVLTTKQCVHLKWVGLPLLSLKPCNNADKRVTSRGQKQGTRVLLKSSCVVRLLHGFDALSLAHCFAYQNDFFYLCLPEERPQKKIFLRQYKNVGKGWLEFPLSDDQRRTQSRWLDVNKWNGIPIDFCL